MSNRPSLQEKNRKLVERNARLVAGNEMQRVRPSVLATPNDSKHSLPKRNPTIQPPYRDIISNEYFIISYLPGEVIARLSWEEVSPFDLLADRFYRNTGAGVGFSCRHHTGHMV